MAGSLILLDEETVSSGVSSVTLGASDWDSSYNVYMVEYNNVVADTDAQYFRIRVLKSSSADTTSNYDQAYKKFDEVFDMICNNQIDQAQKILHTK